MAYELSSSIANSDLVGTHVVGSHNVRGGHISPDGNTIAIAAHRVNGALTVDYGIEFYTSGSSGWTMTDFIDDDGQLPYSIHWLSNSKIWVNASQYMYVYDSSSSGWSLTDTLTKVSSGQSHMYPNRDNTKVAFHETYTTTNTGTMDDNDPIYVYESSSSGWTSSTIIHDTAGNAQTTAIAWIDNNNLVIGQPYAYSGRGKMVHKYYNGSSWSTVSSITGSLTSDWLGSALHYHTGSDTLLVVKRNSSNLMELYGVPSSSAGVLPGGYWNSYSDKFSIDISGLVSSKGYLLTSYGAFAEDPNNGNLLIGKNGGANSTPYDGIVYFSLESGSADGWKVEQINYDGGASSGDAATNGQNDLYSQMHSRISSGASRLALNTTGSYTNYGFMVYDTGLSAAGGGDGGGSVTLDWNPSSPGVIECPTAANPEGTLTLPGGALDSETSITVDSTKDADPNTNGITKAFKGAIAASKVWTITPHNTVFNVAYRPTFQFSLTGDYAGTEPANLRIVKRANEYSPWRLVSTSDWSISSGEITLKVSSLSQFGAIIGGNTMARTKLNNYQLEKLLSGGTGTDAIGASIKALDIIGSGSGDEQVTAISTTAGIADHYLVMQSSSGDEPVKVSISVLQDFFSSVDMTDVDNSAAEYGLLFKSGSNSLAYDSVDSVTWNPDTETLSVSSLTSSVAATFASLTSDSVDINGGAIDGVVIGANSAAAAEFTTVSGSGAAQFASMHSDSVNIDGGAIDGTVIGANSAAAAEFTTVSGSGAAQFASMHSDSVDIDGGAIDGTVIGGTSQAAGSFTTISGSSTLQVGGEATLASAIVSDLTDNRVVIAGVNGALEDDAGFTFDGTSLAVSASGGIDVNQGDLNVAAGAISGSGNLQAGGSATIATGLTVTAGGLTVSAGNSSVQQLTVNGDLIVAGTTTTVDSTNTLIQDPLLVIGSSSNGSASLGDRGILFDDADGTNQLFMWDNSEGHFTLGSTTSGHDATGNFNITAGDLKLNDLTGSAAKFTGVVSASAYQGDGSQLQNVGASVSDSSDADLALQVPFLSGSGASTTLFIDSGSFTFNPNTKLLGLTAVTASGDVKVGALYIDNVEVTATSAELNHLDGIADAGYDQANDSVVFFDATDSKLKYESANDFTTALAGDGLTSTSGQLVVQVSGAVKLASDKVGLSGSIAGDGLAYAGGVDSISALSVNVDDTGIEISSDTLQLKDDGVTAAKLNSDVAGTGLEQHTDGSIRIAAAAAGDGLAGGAGSALALDISEFGDVAVATGDKFLMLDSDGSTHQLESIDDISSFQAGAGLVASAGVLAVVNATNGGLSVNADDVNLDLDDLAAAVVDVAADSIAIIDASDGGSTKKESVADLVAAMSGSGIQAASGKFSIDAREEVFTSSSMTAGLTASLALSSSQILDNSLAVYLNGMLQLESGSVASIFDFKVDVTNTEKILMEAALDSDDILTVRYIKK